MLKQIRPTRCEVMSGRLDVSPCALMFHARMSLWIHGIIMFLEKHGHDCKFEHCAL